MAALGLGKHQHDDPGSQHSSDARLRSGDADFMSDLRESLLVQSSPGSMMVLYLVAAIIVVGLVWSHFAVVEEITQGPAKIIPAGHEQIIQSLEGGILAELGVKEGDVVEKGQVLLKIDPTRANSLYKEGYSKLLGLKATVARLRAEAYGTPLVFPEDVMQSPEIAREAQQSYQARRKAVEESIASLEASYKLASSEIALSEPLSARGLMSQVEILRMKRQANELRMQIVERRNRYMADANAELSRLELELAQTKENLVGRADVMERTTIVAPVRGTIKDVRVTTIGGVIQPGERIMELVPLEGRLLVEAKIKPADVAFLRIDLPAMVKISAYDFGIYGGLKGRITHISPDTLREDQRGAPGRPEDSYYRVLVLTESSELEAGGKRLPIIPGMTATAEIRTGEKTILSYLLKPLFKAREAFRER